MDEQKLQAEIDHLRKRIDDAIDALNPIHSGYLDGTPSLRRNAHAKFMVKTAVRVLELALKGR